MKNSIKSYLESCPVGCHSDLGISEISLPEGPLKRCHSCGHLFSQCSEDLYWDSMKEFHEPEGTWQSGEGAIRLLRFTKRTIKRIERILSKRAADIRLLDVGCSSGSFVAAACSLGVKAEGVEPSSAPAETARGRGLKVHQGFLKDLRLPDNSFDVVTLFEVIEHLKEPIGLFKECCRVLCHGGLLVIRTGNTDSWTAKHLRGRWEYFSINKHGGHVSFFNPLSIRIAAQRSGFLIEDLKTHRVSFCQRGEIPYILYRLVKLFSESLNLPSVWLGKGHELLVFLRKPY